MTIRQADLARELATSEMTISRLLRGLYRDSQEAHRAGLRQGVRHRGIAAAWAFRSVALELVNDLGANFVMSLSTAKTVAGP